MLDEGHRVGLRAGFAPAPQGDGHGSPELQDRSLPSIVEWFSSFRGRRVARPARFGVPGARRVRPRAAAPERCCAPGAGRRPRSLRVRRANAAPFDSGGAVPLAVAVVACSLACSSARLSRNEIGDRTAWLIFSVEGMSGKVPLTSDSRRWRSLRKSPQSPPICLATFGSLSGPSTTSTTTRITSNLAGLRNVTSASVRPSERPPGADRVEKHPAQRPDEGRRGAGAG